MFVMISSAKRFAGIHAIQQEYTRSVQDFRYRYDGRRNPERAWRRQMCPASRLQRADGGNVPSTCVVHLVTLVLTKAGRM